MPADCLVVAGSGGFEIGEVDRIVDVTERIGIAVPDLDGMPIAKFTLERTRTSGS